MPLLSVDSRLVRFLERIFELVVLNLLTLLCSIPLVTIGVAFTALYRSLFNMRQGNAGIIKGYFIAFRDNFRSGLLLGLILLVFCISFGLYIYFFRDLIAAGDALVLIGIVLVGVFFFFPMTLAFPLLSMFDDSALRTLSNAFLLGFRHLATTMAVLIMFGLPWLILFLAPSWFLRIIPLVLLFCFSLPGWFASSLFLKIFKKYSSI